MNSSSAAGVGATLVMASTTFGASTVIVSPGDGFWVSSGNSGGGSSAITSTLPRSGNGSVEMSGDRTRFGTQVLDFLSDVSTFTFDWAVALDSVAGLPNYTPALRLHVVDGDEFSELIWEGTYNGVTDASIDRDTWYTSSDTDTFWRWVTGSGLTLDNGAQVNLTVADWASSSWYSEQAVVYGISVGVGGSAGAGYHAFADNITLGFGDDVTIYNFEVVPTPAAALPAMALVGGLLVVRRRQSVA